MIGAANAPAEWVAEQIREVRKRTDRPFGVNIMLMSPHADEVARTVARERVPVVTTGAGNPEQYMTLWKEKDIRVIPVIASVAMANGWKSAEQMQLWQRAMSLAGMSEKVRQ